MSLLLRYIRVTNSTKLKDEFLTAQVQKLDNEITNHFLFSLVEIKRPWHRSSQIGQVIINNFQRSYAKGKDENQLENFENSLKETNETLNKIYNSGEIDWVGRLSASIMLSVENNIHFTTSGETKIILYRNSTISAINQEKVSSNPQKTFGAITSGKIQNEDIILIANKKLFDELTLSQISDSVKGLNCLQATENIIRQIRSQNRKYVNFILIEVLDDHSTASKEQLPQNHFYIDRDVEKVHQIILKNIKKIGSLFAVKAFFFSKGLWHSSRKFSKDKLTPIYQNKFKKYFKTIYLTVAKGSSKTSDYLLKSSDGLAEKIDNRISHYKDNNTSTVRSINEPGFSISYDKNLVGKNIFTVYDYQKESTGKNLSKFSKKTSLMILIIFKYIFSTSRFIVSFIFKQKNKKILLLFCIAFLVLILILGVKFQRNSQKVKISQKHEREILDQADRKLEEAKTSLVFKKNDDAEKQLSEVVTLINQIDPSSTLYQSAKQSLKTAEGEYDKLTNTSRNESVAVNNYNINRITNISGQVYFTTLDNKLYKFNQTLDSDELANVVEARTVSAISSHQENNIIFILSNTGLSQFPLNTKIITPVTTKSDKAISVGDKIKIYLGNIYILNKADKQIYKYINFENRYLDQQNYLKETDGVDNSIDFAIDGNIYLLLADGNITKYSKGSKQDLSIKNIPSPATKIISPISIFTVDNSNSFYTLDKPNDYRVLSFSKNGDYQKQIIIKDSGQSIVDMVVDENNKKIYLASDKGMYLVDL